MHEADRNFCSDALPYLKWALPTNESAIELPKNESPVITNLNNGLLATYVVDREKHFQYVQEKHLVGTPLTKSELHKRAITNLLNMVSRRGLEVRAHGNIFAVLFGGNFEASLILIDELWSNRLARLVPNGFIAALPSRDVLAFCDTKNDAGVQELRQVIQRVENGDHPISPILYRRCGATWKQYVE